jgi:hypothetical protein
MWHVVGCNQFLNKSDGLYTKLKSQANICKKRSAGGRLHGGGAPSLSDAGGGPRGVQDRRASCGGFAGVLCVYHAGQGHAVLCIMTYRPLKIRQICKTFIQMIW